MTFSFRRVPRDSTNGRQHRQIISDAIAQIQDNALTEESGTWTPTLTIGGVSTGVTYASAVGEYDRIGNLVFFTAFVFLSSKGAAAGEVHVGNLPFPVLPGSAYRSVSVIWTQLATGVSVAAARTDASANAVVLLKEASGAFSKLMDTDLANNSQFIVSGCYRVS